MKDNKFPPTLSPLSKIKWLVLAVFVALALRLNGALLDEVWGFLICAVLILAPFTVRCTECRDVLLLQPERRFNWGIACPVCGTSVH
jgi:hypothetical protein